MDKRLIAYELGRGIVFLATVAAIIVLGCIAQASW